MARVATYKDAKGIVVRVESGKQGNPIVTRGMIVANGCTFYEGVTRLGKRMYLEISTQRYD